MHNAEIPEIHACQNDQNIHRKHMLPVATHDVSCLGLQTLEYDSLYAFKDPLRQMDGVDMMGKGFPLGQRGQVFI